MNIAFLLQPKNDTAFLYDDFTLRQGLEKMKHHGYTAIPVIDREGKYVTTISEGDFLWFILRGQEGGDLEEVPVQKLEDTLIREVMHVDKNPPVPITASTDELVERGLEQNFIPVVDD
ncbi:MAG: CBS domain-containing protein, partial [Firmicutes bacterium]|nr:CBS domain-containing protein [Bacillota bacterium]